MTEQTLLLNADYLPLDVVHWQRAMVLWCQNKVEILETHDHEVRAVTFSFRLPSVVRLLQFVKTRRKSQVQFTRANIYARDKHVCQYCCKQHPTQDLTFDHVMPVSRGGLRTWENIVTCCIPCNRRKGNRTPDEAGMKLKQKPVKPGYSPIFRVTMGIRKTPESWMDYIFWNATLDNDEDTASDK